MAPAPLHTLPLLKVRVPAPVFSNAWDPEPGLVSAPVIVVLPVPLTVSNPFPLAAFAATFPAKVSEPALLFVKTVVAPAALERLTLALISWFVVTVLDRLTEPALAKVSDWLPTEPVPSV